MRQKIYDFLKFNNISLISIATVILSLISLIISMKSAYYSNEANDISKMANKLAKESNMTANRSIEIAESDSLFEKKQRSSQLVDEQYNSIFNNLELNATMNDILYTNNNVNKKSLGQIVDIFENLGMKYCKGIIFKEDIRGSFLNSLYSICNNSQIYDSFGGRKNATSLLCYHFIPGSVFTKTLVKSSLETCLPIK